MSDRAERRLANPQPIAAMPADRGPVPDRTAGTIGGNGVA